MVSMILMFINQYSSYCGQRTTGGWERREEKRWLEVSDELNWMRMKANNYLWSVWSPVEWWEPGSEHSVLQLLKLLCGKFEMGMCVNALHENELMYMLKNIFIWSCLHFHMQTLQFYTVVFHCTVSRLFKGFEFKPVTSTKSEWAASCKFKLQLEVEKY